MAARPIKWIPNFVAGFLTTERTAPATPAAGTLAVYAGSDHRLHTLDSTGLDNPIGTEALLVHTVLSQQVI